MKNKSIILCITIFIIIVFAQDLHAYGTLYKVNDSKLEKIELRKQNTFIKHDGTIQSVFAVVQNLFSDNET